MKEFKIVLELLKHDNQNIDLIMSDKNTNWINVLGYLTYHRVAGLAYEKIKQIGARSFEYPVYMTTSMINKAQRERAKEQNRWINLISNKLIEQNIEHAFLKGSILNNTLFKYGSRISNDIDILINKDSIEKVTSILNNLGFIQGKYNYKTKEIISFTNDEKLKSIMTRGETSPFVLKTNKSFIETIDVDLNFSIDFETNDLQIVKDFLNKRIQISKHDNIKVYSLNNYFNFLELCSHFYKDTAIIDILKKRKIIDLYKIIDIYYFIEKYSESMDIKKLLYFIKKYKLEKQVYFTLIHITNLFPDCNNQSIKTLINCTKQEDVINCIFSQNKNLTMTSETSIINRVASYNVIKKYRKKV